MKYLNVQIILGFLSVSLSSERAVSRELNDVELFRRCFAQLTQEAIKHDDPLLKAVREKTKNYSTACMEVLDRAKFSATQNREALSLTKDGKVNELGLKVLKTMNEVHQTFFSQRELMNTGDDLNSYAIRGIYDPGEPALFYTRALFSGKPANYLVKATDNLRADRKQNNPNIITINQFGIKQAINKTGTKGTIFDNVSWAPLGELHGVQVTGDLTFNVNTLYQTQNGVKSVDAGKTRGGGILGTPTYFLDTVKTDNGQYKADTLVIPRKWSKAIFADFLCRELPVINQGDEKIYVTQNPNSTTNAFRKVATCVSCHASMDQMAGVNRNFTFKYLRYSDLTNNRFGGIFPAIHPLDSRVPSVNGNDWPDHPDDNYYKRATKGRLLYRNSEGKLQDQEITSIADLGSKLSQEPDFYRCIAKRYYKYFTGIDVSLAPGSNSKDPQLSVVKKLGDELQKDQSLRTLIEKILNSKAYKNTEESI